MAQETDTVTGNALNQADSRADPLTPVAHRTAIAAADGTTKPAANDAKWLVNPGYRAKCRVFVTATGTPTAAATRPYIRSGGSTGQVGQATLQALNGAPNYDAFYDVQVDGDDILVYVETLTGGTSPTVTVTASWR